MSEQDGNPLKRDAVIAQLEVETRQRGFVEYPKMLHKTDGGNITVNNKAEEEAALRGADVHPTPDLALAEKAKRDEAARVAEQNAIAAAASAEQERKLKVEREAAAALALQREREAAETEGKGAGKGAGGKAAGKGAGGDGAKD